MSFATQGEDSSLVTEELLAIKVAIQYRSCTQHISSRLVQKGAQGSVSPHIGAVRLDNVRFLPLQHAVSQAKTRGLFVPIGGPHTNSTNSIMNSITNTSVPSNSNAPSRSDGIRTDRVFFGIADSLTKIRRAVMDSNWLRADVHRNITGSFTNDADVDEDVGGVGGESQEFGNSMNSMNSMMNMNSNSTSGEGGLIESRHFHGRGAGACRTKYNNNNNNTTNNNNGHHNHIVHSVQGSREEWQTMKEFVDQEGIAVSESEEDIDIDISARMQSAGNGIEMQTNPMLSNKRKSNQSDQSNKSNSKNTINTVNVNLNENENENADISKDGSTAGTITSTSRQRTISNIATGWDVTDTDATDVRTSEHGDGSDGSDLTVEGLVADLDKQIRTAYPHCCGSR